jgi:membrane fusion protein, multidrug efflux system
VLWRRPLAFASDAVLLLFLALPAGYLYWDYASHFEATDDAFIAARHFTMAPKVPDYLTAVPVTGWQSANRPGARRAIWRSPS